MTEYDRAYTDRLNQRLRDNARELAAVRRSRAVVAILAILGWVAAALLGFVWLAVAAGCAVLIVAGWWL